MEAEINATFSPPPGEWATLSKTSRGTMEALYQHPLSHNLEWSRVVALFDKLGTVDQEGHNEIKFGVGGEHHRIRKPHGKDLTTTEVMAFRHMLTRAGWAPPVPACKAGADASGQAAAVRRVSPDILVVIDHHEARLYHLDVRSKDLVDDVIKPFDPHHLLDHVSHNDQAREQRQRLPEDRAFYESIAQAVAAAGAVVLIGHGSGRSNAAHQLDAFLQKHHPDTARKVVCELVADLPGLTAPQLLELGRRALGEHSRHPAGPSASIPERLNP